MSKAKTASKNNPTAREKEKEVFYNGKKVKPAKFISRKFTFFAAEYEDGSLVVDANGEPLPWSRARGF